jgi:hypothetical protein
MVADIEDEPSEVEPLPNIDFNIRQGNTLIGFTDIEEVATEEGDASLTNYGGGLGENVQEMYRDVIRSVERHRESESAREAAEARREAEKLIEEYGQHLHKKILKQFKGSGVENITFDDVLGYSPFHWVLEFARVYRDGGFDVIVGNPPWDVLSSSSDEFFAQYNPTFRSLDQEEKEAFMDEKLSDPKVKSEWESYQENIGRLTEYFKNSGEYTLQTPEVAGETATYKNDLSKLFFERVFHLVDDDAYLSQVLPGLIVNGEGSKDLRMQLLNETSVQSIIEFENNGIFDIHKQQRFAVITFKNSGRTEDLWGVFDQKDTRPFTNLEEFGLHLPRRVLAEYSPEARIFPWVKSQREVEVLDKILQHPPLSAQVEDAWSINLLPEELNETRDKRKGYFDQDVDNPDYPVYTGSNVFQYQYDDTLSDANDPPTYWSVEEDRDPDSSAKRRIREKRFNAGEPKRALYDDFGGPSTSKSQIGFVNDLLTKHRGEELSEKDVLLDSSEYRIAYRDVASSTNERTMIATVLPKDVLCVHTLATFRPYEINPTEDNLKQSPLHGVYDRRFSDHELFVALGLINSLSFDYLMRTKTDKHLVEYKLLESKLPRLTEGADWFYYISKRASQLNCYGEEFTEMRDRLGGINPVTDEQERRELQAEIDAAAFHAYGLNRRDVEFILNDFHRVSDPRIMTDAYFDMVFEKYDVLEQTGPQP